MSDQLCFCGVEMELAQRVQPWQRRQLRYCIHGSLPGLSAAQLQAACAEAFGSWSDVCGLSFAEVHDPSACDILLTTGTIDRPGGILAWSELPDGSDRRLQQRYDTQERFVIASQPPPGRIDLVAVVCHEVGHALGLEHASRDAADLMAPVYAPGRRTPQAGDVARIRALYGPPLPRPEPQPGDPDHDPPAQIWVVGQSGRITARFQLERLPDS